MPDIVGQLLGAVLGMILFSALVAWIVRKVAKVEIKRSYLVGTGVMMIVAPTVYVAGNENKPFLDAFVMYAIGGAIAYPVLVAMSRKKSSKADKLMEHSQDTTAIWFVAIGGSEAGPFTKSIVEGYLTSGALTLDDVCWREGFPDWIQLGRTVEFAPRLSLPPRSDQFQNNAASRTAIDNPKQKNYLNRHWRGELSLPKSYWLNSYGLTAVFMLLFLGLSTADFTLYPKLISALFIGSWILLGISQVWLTVGICRSARVYSTSYPSRKGWGTAAIFFATVGLISTGSVIVKQGIPQIIGLSEIIVTAIQKKSYSTRLLRNSTEIELSGPLDFGVSGDVEAMLNDYPTVTTLHLNSLGGRLAEAEKLKDIVLKRNLNTYVGVECQSACVTVFIAGRNRLISRTAVIGLHETYFPGLDDTELAAATAATKEFFYSQGIDGTTIEKGFSVVHTDMWKPEHSVLFSSHIATGYANDDDVALSGISLSGMEEGLATIAALPLYAAIKEKYPSDFQKIMNAIRDGLLKGKSLQEMRSETMPLMEKFYEISLPTASISSIEQFIKLLSDQAAALLVADARKCVSYMKGDSSGFNMSDIPLDLQSKEAKIGVDVIRSTGSYAGPTISETEVQRTLLNVIAKASESLGLTEEDYIKGMNHELDATTNCKVFIAYFNGLTEVPAFDRPKLLRYIAQNMKQ